MQKNDLHCCTAAYISWSNARRSCTKRKEFPMTKVEDMTKALKDMMGSFPVDMSAFDDAFKNTASMNEKLANVAVEAAEKSAEISSKWTKDTLAKIADVSKAKADPADYAKAAADFATAQAEVAAENMAAFAEVAKKVQMDTVELLMSTGKNMSEEATAAVKKATADVTAATRKATAAAK